MAAYDRTALSAALKEFYDDEQFHDTVYEENEWLGMIEKQKKTTGGKHFDFVVRYGDMTSRSADIAKVLANKKTGKYVEFNVQTVEDYAAVSIDRKTMMETDGDEMAFFQAQTRAVDDGLRALSRSLAQGLIRGKGGSVGQVGSVSTVTLTLKNIEDIANFEVGDVLVESTNDGSVSTHTLLDGGASATVTAVDTDAGTLTSGSNWAAQMPSIAADKYLFKDGDFQEKVSGFGDWNPATAPTAGDSFHAADRSPHPGRLAGSRITATGDPVTEALLKGSARLGRNGGKCDTGILGPNRMRDLLIELGNQVQYTEVLAKDATISFTGVKVATSKGPITCFADHNADNNVVQLTKKANWKLLYSGKDVPEIQDEDGNMLFRETGSDGYEVRMSYYANGVCLNPRDNCRVTVG